MELYETSSTLLSRKIIEHYEKYGELPIYSPRELTTFPIQSLEKLYLITKIHEYNTFSRGRNDGFRMTLDSVNSKVTKIFFNTYENSDINIPANTFINHPRHPIAHLTIVNMGPNDLLYSTDRSKGEEELADILEAGEDHEIDTQPRRTITSLFLRPLKRTFDADGNPVVDTVTVVRVKIIS